MTAAQIIQKYISFFEARGHKRIPSAPLVPENDPTTLFTSSGMQPLIPYLLGEKHPEGKRLVDVQNSFRAVDIEEVGDNRHTTFFRMLGNWSLGDYFKKEQIPWMWELYTKDFGLDPKRLYVSIFAGDPQQTIKSSDGKESPLGFDTDALVLWQEIFKKENLSTIVADMTNPQTTEEIIRSAKIFQYSASKNWWSRSGTPDKMPAGELGGPDTEMFYDFGSELKLHEQSQWKDEVCHPNCDCGRYWEIGNSVFMQYLKQEDGSFKPLPKQNVDFGGGLERIIGATEHKIDMFLTSLFAPTIQTIEKVTDKKYEDHTKAMQVIADHFGGSMAMIASGVVPSNKEQGYILRRLLRRSLDELWQLNKNADVQAILETIVQQYKETDPELVEKFENISLAILTETQNYQRTLENAKKLIEKEITWSYSSSKARSSQPSVSNDKNTTIGKVPGIKRGDELMGIVEISAETAFKAVSSFGLSPTQLKSLGYTFDEQEFSQKMEEHQKLSQTASAGKFRGGLADAQELTVKGHTATHLLQQALRDMFGTQLHQTGSNITTERLRFDFNYDKKLTDEEMRKIEQTVNEKIKEDLPVHFEMLPLQKAKGIGAIGLFDEKYNETVKVYIIGGSGKDGDYNAYSKEFCGGPHVPHTSIINSFTITKQESIGNGQQRLYARVS